VRESKVRRKEGRSRRKWDTQESTATSLKRTIGRRVKTFAPAGKEQGGSLSRELKDRQQRNATTNGMDIPKRVRPFIRGLRDSSDLGLNDYEWEKASNKKEKKGEERRTEEGGDWNRRIRHQRREYSHEVNTQKKKTPT